jgi:hypothetical protein
MVFPNLEFGLSQSRVPSGQSDVSIERFVSNSILDRQSWMVPAATRWILVSFMTLWRSIVQEKKKYADSSSYLEQMAYYFWPGPSIVSDKSSADYNID